MKAIANVIQGNEDEFRGRAYQAVIETGKPSLIRKFESTFDKLEFEDQIDFVSSLLKSSNIFY